jgi:hypothetical protein
MIEPYYQDEWATIYLGDCREILPQLEPVSLILTDPPYPKQFIPLYGDLARMSRSALRPGGLLAAMCGKINLPEILNLMTEHLQFHWMIAYLMPGGQASQIWTRKVIQNWKPVLLFSNGQYTGRWISDVAQSNGNDKRFHKWGQSISGMKSLIVKLTKGESEPILIDPFMGGGATIKAAKDLCVRSIGIELDEQHCITAVERLRQESLLGLIERG